MSKNRQFIFTNLDIDGSLSYLILSWITGQPIPYKSTSVFNLEKDFSDWYRTNGEKYERVYVLGVDVSQCANVLNRDNVVVFAHKLPITELSNAKVVTSKEDSTSMLLYKSFAKKISFKDRQKLLVLLVNDIKKHTFDLPYSRELDMLYRAYTGDKLSKFTTDFNIGYDGFSDKQKRLINFYKKSVENIIKDLNVFKGTIPFKGKTYNVVSTFAEKYINEISDKLLDDYNSDVCFVVNVDKERVSFRRSKNCDLDLSILADKISHGGEFPYAASGIMNENFITITKLFKQVK